MTDATRPHYWAACSPLRAATTIQSGDSLGHRVHLQTQPQQKLDYIGSAILASLRKAALHLLLRRVGS